MAFEQLGPYKIGRRLGRGGMGTVYAAIDSASGAATAVKVLAASLCGDEGFRDRFDAEIASLRKLSHPNIVRLLGFGEQDGVLYYAMELVEGESLEEELRRRGPFDWRVAAEFGLQVCRALKHAHDRGIIHRDIKPANLLLAPDGLLKLSDFGIAKLFGHTGITADGGVIGTAEYMAPEQADGRPVSARCDLYSLGAVLYALLTGRPPFQAETLPEMLQMQRYAEAERLRRFAAGVPAELEDIVHQLLLKDPEARIPSALVLSRRLEAVRLGPDPREAEPAAPQPADPSTAETRPAPPSPPPPPAASSETTELRGTVGHAGDRPAGTSAPTNPDRPEHAAAAHAEPARAANRYTVVPDDEQRRRETVDDPTPAWALPQTWALAVALAAVAFAVWYFWRPATADQLYRRIAAAAKDDELTLLPIQNDINAFLATYPDDPRRDEVLAYQDKSERIQLERRLSWQSHSNLLADKLTPVERAYLDARRLAQTDPVAYRRKLTALLDLYGPIEAGLSPPARECLALARGQLRELDGEQKRIAPKEVQTLAEHAARAERLAISDPAAARKVWQALIELYGDKPWAQPVVERARDALAELGAEPKERVAAP